MTIRINKRNLIHYILIYFLIVINQSCIYEYFLRDDIFRIGIFIIFSLLIVKSYKKTYNKYVEILAVLLACTTLTRLIAGGIGLRAWIDYAIPIIVCVYTIRYDLDHFLERFIKITVFLAGIGLVFFIVQIMNPELLKDMLPFKYATGFTYNVWDAGGNVTNVNYPGYGLFLYSYRASDAAMRNKGIFTESGICQMLYNSVMFVLLYFPEKTNLTTRQIKRCFAILIAAIVTVQSTTGYIISGCLLISYLLVRQKKKKSIKGYIASAVLVLGLGLIVDFSIRGTDSFFSIAILKKIFGDNNQLEIQGSGMARVEAILLSLGVMATNPFGVGADNLMNLIASNLVDGGGAGIFKFGATAGIIPLLICMLFYIIPIAKSNSKRLIKILLLFMIFYTLSAQSNPFYPLLIIFPIYLLEEKRWIVCS